MPSEINGTVSDDGTGLHPAAEDRYHMYVSLSCPYAARVMITRALKGLDKVVPVTILGPDMFKTGWVFTDEFEKCSLDTVNNCNTLREVYQLAKPGYTGRASVPLLWDKVARTAVNNDSAELLRIFNSSFNAFCPTEEQRNLNLYPEHLRDEINSVNAWVSEYINDGVYSAGLEAETQEDYDTAVKNLFEHLDKAEDILSRQRYLVGNTLTEADVRLFPTLLRFDWVYHTLFKCNRRMIHEYKNLWGFVRDIYQMPGVADTVDRDYIIYSYFAGDRLPDISVYEGSPDNAIYVSKLFQGKKGVLFSVVGAFTPGCSQAHIPEYLQNYDKFKDEGYDLLACVSVNDPYVMAAWEQDTQCEGKIRMLADPAGTLTKALDMELDTTTLLGNKRSKRYSMLVEDGVVKQVNMDPDSSGLACLLCIRKQMPTKRTATVR